MSRRSWFALVGLVGLFGAAWSVKAAIFERDERWVVVEATQFMRRIAASGELRSANAVSIGPPQIRRMWRFTVSRMAPEGKAIDKGAPIVSFDTRSLDEKLELRRSELETARKKLEKTELQTEDKYEALVLELVELRAKRARIEHKLAVPEELRSRIELEKIRIEAELAAQEVELTEERVRVQQQNREARVKASKQRVDTLTRTVERIESDIRRMTVCAPRAGFVVHLTGWNGEKAQIGESVWYGRRLLEIADLTHMELAAEIAEPDAGRVALGQRAEIRLDAAPEKTFTGRIERLGRLFRTKSWESPSRVFDATISIDDADPELMRPGMAASIEILSPSEEGLLDLPEDAIVRGKEGPAVYARTAEGFEGLVPVCLGERHDGRVVIRKGLGMGDRVRLLPSGGV